jgi:hypothetical protein
MGKAELKLAEKLRTGRVSAKKTTQEKIESKHERIEKKMAKKDKKEKEVEGPLKIRVSKGLRSNFRSDIGQFGYLYLLEPNRKGQFDKNKLTAQVMWTEEEYTVKRTNKKKETYTIKEKLEEAVLEIARIAYKKKDITLADFDNPIKVGNDQPKPGIFKDRIYITAKKDETKEHPRKFGPIRSDGDLPEKEVKALKPGDFGLLAFAIYPYTKGTGGIAFDFDAIQLYRKGPALTGGVEASVSLLDDLEVELESEEDEDTDTEESDQDGDAEEEDSSADGDQDGDDDDEDDDDDDDEEEDDDDDEDDEENFKE